ncbi:MAG: hypothetical protein U9Q22_02610 [Candidatus Altiarchaeota archaeon]|nr:hypothetical protein [Candidatus Altiarchaeota archaeon]
MRKLKIILGIVVLIILLFLGINAIYAPPAGGSQITEEEYLGAYFVVGKDVYRGEGKFTKNHLLDVIEFYLANPNLDDCVSETGGESGEPIYHVLFKAGVNECLGGYECTTPGDTCCAYNWNTQQYEEYVCA